MPVIKILFFIECINYPKFSAWSLFISQQRIIAAFDFDGTLTYRDTLIPFLFFSAGKAKTLTSIFLSIPYFFEFVVTPGSRQEVKESLLTHSIKGREKKEIEQFGEKFAKEKIPHLLRPEAVQRLKWHQQNGHECVLVSANLDVYLKFWGNMIGFQRVICSICETDEQGLLTGKLVGPNCWGPEKVRCLSKILGPRDQCILYAYGNSKGDKELLAYADYPFYKKME